MAQTQISDVVVPAEFSAYIVENSMVITAIFQSGVALPNGLISEQLQAGSTQFTVPVWSDGGESETDVMPHIIVKLWPGKSENQKRKLAEEITRSVMSMFYYGEESVSVAFEEIEAED